MGFLLGVGALLILPRRLATGGRGAAAASPPVPQDRLEVLPAVENALDQHRIRRDDKGDRDAAFEASHSQSGQDIVARCTPQRERRKSVAEFDDAVRSRPLFLQRHVPKYTHAALRYAVPQAA